MMKITSVICEYNPFHKGHAYQLSEMKKEGAVIALMSGSFTQRGTPAVLSKYERAETAVCLGADLVLELPFPFCTARAELFGGAGVDILHRLGCVDSLCFGSESGDISALSEAEQRLSSAEFEETLKALLEKDRSLSHHKAMDLAYSRLYGESSPLFSSNDLLALSYLRALRALPSPIVPHAIRRVGERYNGEGEGFRSATSIRGLLFSGELDALRDALPKESAESLIEAAEAGAIHREKRLYPLFASLMRTRKSIVETLPDIPSELLSRMKKAALTAKNTEEFLTLSATKLHSPSRVRRGMLYALLDVKAEDLSSPRYTTVLAANEKGREILSLLRKTTTLPIITKPADAGLFGSEVLEAFSLAARADSIWELLSDMPAEGNRMMKEKPRML